MIMVRPTRKYTTHVKAVKSSRPAPRRSLGKMSMKAVTNPSTATNCGTHGEHLASEVFFCRNKGRSGRRVHNEKQKVGMRERGREVEKGMH